MRAEELSVGDFVYSSFCEQPCKVTYIAYTVHGYSTVGVENVFGLKDFASLTPIQLTAEILKKNEFIDYSFPFAYFRSKDRRINVEAITNSGDGYWCVHVNNERFETIGCCDIRFVHEMQHLLRLCKYELDLNL